MRNKIGNNSVASKPKHLLIFWMLLLVVLFLSGCGTSNSSDAEKSSIEELVKVEVTEYEGKDLSSIADFRENSIKGPQYIDISTYRLKIDGLVEKTTEWTYEEVLDNKPYKKLVTLNCVEGWSVDILWEGVLLQDLFATVDVKDSANTVIFHSEDGYTTSLPLQAILDREMLLAYKMNDVVLPPERGFPFQLVAEDKLGYKWAKWITRIELSDDVNYKGYWEQRGFDNDATIN
ncbi:molybdopterin-dependent oxidoreductase [Jeotgalibaca sp. A127]|uniref:molybdopterin-dependent oxidoreductase n=1 Tax=Jeotgalibaca sp. A127 TaxID=3457324 RepID=UPI003FD2F698